MVVTLAFILVFPTARLYMSQQVEKAELRSAVEAAKAENGDLKAQLGRWEDPAFVKAQARERLTYVMPGERSYRVSDPQNAPSPPASAAPSSAPQHLAANSDADAVDPWYAVLWDSTVVAGSTP
jgi:hypothetical protein